MDNTKLALYILGGLALAFLIFHAGVVVGAEHAHGEPFGGAHGLPHGFLEHGHGAVGSIQSVSTSTLMLATPAHTTETILLATTTEVRAGNATTTALVPGERVLVLGQRDSEGRLVADVIRIFSH